MQVTVGLPYRHVALFNNKTSWSSVSALYCLAIAVARCCFWVWVRNGKCFSEEIKVIEYKCRITVRDRGYLLNSSVVQNVSESAYSDTWIVINNVVLDCALQTEQTTLCWPQWLKLELRYWPNQHSWEFRVVSFWICKVWCFFDW